jgi:hypothetical protein
LKIADVAQMFGLIFFHGTRCVLSLAKNSLATFWWTLSQTRQVTLDLMQQLTIKEVIVYPICVLKIDVESADSFADSIAGSQQRKLVFIFKMHSKHFKTFGGNRF